MRLSGRARIIVVCGVLTATGIYFTACSGISLGTGDGGAGDGGAGAATDAASGDTSSSDSTANVDGNGLLDAAKGDAADGGDPGDAAEGGDAADAGDAGDADAPDCSANPQLRDYSAGFRCAFADAGNCINGETCCYPGGKGAIFPPSFCATGKNGDTTCAGGAAAAGSSYDDGGGAEAWECADKSACSPGQVCCLIQNPLRLALDPVNNRLNIGNTPATDKNHPPSCGVQRVYNEGGSRCKAACEAAKNDIRLCSLTDNSCGAGTTCTPFVDFTNAVDRAFCK
jgi:hypothetical protein